ncbi:MAG: DUF1624 domain-containing protein [Alphaproteobacteria bacterium]
MSGGEDPVEAPTVSSPRYGFIDVAKGVAIVAMVIYHTGFDLSLQRLIAVDVVNDLGWTIFARLIAATFVALVGFNLVLATASGLNPRRYGLRLVAIVASAGIVSLATWLFDASTFIFFGILHQIALASVLGLAFVRLPLIMVTLAAAAVIALPLAVRMLPLSLSLTVFDAPWLWWVGLSTKLPASLDYVPLFPWFGVALAGMVAGRLFLTYATLTRFARWTPRGLVARAAVVAGRWTLPIYLIHQPVLLGLIFLATPLFAPLIDRERAGFTRSCVPVCTALDYGQPACTAYCTCLFEGLYDTDLYAITAPERMSRDQRGRWDVLRRHCSAAMPAEAE